MNLNLKLEKDFIGSPYDLTCRYNLDPDSMLYGSINLLTKCRYKCKKCALRGECARLMGETLTLAEQISILMKFALARVKAFLIFGNGEITLEFKGLSVVCDRYCALLGYDSGQSSFKMIMKPMPNMEIQTVGSSHYKGDIYKDLATNWVQKVTMTEFVVSETILPMPPNKITSVIERDIIIRNVSEKEFGSK